MTTDPTPNEVGHKKGPFNSIEDMVDAISDDPAFAAEFRKQNNTTERKLFNLAHVLIAKYDAATGYDDRLAIVLDILNSVAPVIREECAAVAENTNGYEHTVETMGEAIATAIRGMK